MPNTLVPAAAIGLSFSDPNTFPPRPLGEPSSATVPDTLRITPPDRRALRHICAFADVLNLPEGAWLLVPASPALIDLLAAFEADREDAEEDDFGGGDVNDEPELDAAESGIADRDGMDEQMAATMPYVAGMKALKDILAAKQTAKTALAAVVRRQGRGKAAKAPAKRRAAPGR
jgi:hypothetical protein